MNINSKQYTIAFFKVAEEKQCLEKAIRELDSLNTDNITLKNFLANPNMSNENKKDFFKEIKITSEVANFLLILEQNNDLHLLGNIIFDLKKMLNEKSRLAEVEIQVTNMFDDAKIADIKKGLENKLQKKVILSVKTNQKILGGIIIKIGDSLIDNSLKNKLALLKQEMIK